MLRPSAFTLATLSLVTYGFKRNLTTGEYDISATLWKELAEFDYFTPAFSAAPDGPVQ